MISFLSHLIFRKPRGLPTPSVQFDARSSIDNHRRELNTPVRATRHFWRAT